MNFINPILLSIMTKCLPIQVLAPALNPPNTNGGISSHYFYHLSGLKLKGSVKYLVE